MKAKLKADPVSSAVEFPVRTASPAAAEGTVMDASISEIASGNGAGRLSAGSTRIDVPRVPGRRRILVIDDNEDATEMMSMLLGTLGHEVQTAHDGMTALNVVRAFKPDLILLDLGLPEMDGYEIARRLRAQPETANVVLVALTGYGGQDDRRLCLEAGFDLHLVKPLGLDALVSLLGGAK